MTDPMINCEQDSNLWPRVTRDMAHRATLYVCSRAQSTADASELLKMLGLIKALTP